MTRFRAALLALALLPACSMDLAPLGVPLGTVSVTAPDPDPGGGLQARVAEIAALERLGVEKRISGECLSACTMYLGLSTACFEPDAVLGFHGPARLGGTLSPERQAVAAAVMATYYPPRLAAWFLQGPARSDVLVRVRASDLIAAGEARACS